MGMPMMTLQVAAVLEELLWWRWGCRRRRAQCLDW